MSSLKPLFNPQSIAIVGVSQDSNKLGSVIYNNLLKSGYEKDIFLINPKYEELHGKRVYKSIPSVNKAIDIAIIAIPAEFVVQAVEEAARHLVKVAIIISAGFNDIGEEGSKREQALKKITEKYGIRILGPNCLGSISTESKVNASFAALSPKHGSIAFFSQSGAINTAILDMAETINLGFKHFVSLGNKNDINENDLIEEWISDESIKVIGGYLEDFVDGNYFVDIARKSKKPIVILHAGESEAAQRAIESHTGALASSSVVVKTAMKQSGVILVESLEEMFNTLLLASRSPLPKGERIAIITNAGGPAIMATDLLFKNDLDTAAFHKDTVQKLEKELPKEAAIHNPVDLLGDALADRYKEAIDIVSKDQRVDGIFTIMSPQQVTQIEETAKVIINAQKQTEKPILSIFLGDKFISSGSQRLHLANMPVFSFAEEAIKAYKNLLSYSQYKEHTYNLPNVHAKIPKYKKEVNSITTYEPKALPEILAKEIAKEAGLILPQEYVVHTVHEAKRKALKIGYPVVLKVTTETLAHKTEEKAIYLNLRDEHELERAYTKLMRLIQKVDGAEELLLQPYLYSDVELILGAVRDGDSKVYQDEGRGFGHLLLFGHGGIYTEIYNDIATTLIPAKKELMVKNVKHTDVYRILNGYRSNEKYNVDSVVDTLNNIQKLVLLYPEIQAIDINPAFPTQKECICVDVKIFVQK